MDRACGCVVGDHAAEMNEWVLGQSDRHSVAGKYKNSPAAQGGAASPRSRPTRVAHTISPHPEPLALRVAGDWRSAGGGLGLELQFGWVLAGRAKLSSEAGRNWTGAPPSRSALG